MRYISTRGLDTDRSFEDVLLNGLARDGGLYLPKTWPRLSADMQEYLFGNYLGQIQISQIQVRKSFSDCFPLILEFPFQV